MIKELYIIGAGGLGREILATLKSAGECEKYHHIFYIDNFEGAVKSIKIIGNNEFLKNIKYPVDVIIANSNCQIRSKIISELEGIENLNFISFVHPKASIYDTESVKIGKGCFIAEGCVLSTEIIIDDFCYLNVGVSIHHDTIIKKNCFLMAGVRITGGATIGENTFIGNNVQISSKEIIPAYSTIKITN